MSTFLPVWKDQVFGVWDMVAPVLEKAVNRNKGFSMSDVLKGVAAGALQMWLSVTEDNDVEAVGITQIVTYPQKKTCLLLFLGGRDIDHWKPFMGNLEKWAKVNHCEDIEFIGRKGWAKVMTDFDPVETVYRKTLGDEI